MHNLPLLIKAQWKTKKIEIDIVDSQKTIYGAHHYEATFEQWKWGEMNFLKSLPFIK